MATCKFRKIKNEVVYLDVNGNCIEGLTSQQKLLSSIFGSEQTNPIFPCEVVLFSPIFKITKMGDLKNIDCNDYVFFS